MATPMVRPLQGTGYNQLSVPRLTPEKLQLYNQIFGAATPGINKAVSHLSQLAGGGTPEFWQQLEAPALSQFGALQGNIASRFSGMGSGARRSSGFQNELSSRASELSQNLASQRMKYQQGAISDLMSLYRDLMGEDVYDTYLMPEKRKQSGLESFLQGGLPIAGAVAGGLFGGPLGATVGGQLGSTFGSAFSGGEQYQPDFSKLAGLPTKWR